MTLLTLMRPCPFEFRTVVFAKHAQHVVPIHFPIALFVTAVAFDLIAYWTKRRSFADAAYYNLLVAALATIPVLATGIVAWQLQLEGQRLKGNWLLHLLLGSVSSALICLVWWLHLRPRRRKDESPAYRFLIEAVAVLVVIATATSRRFSERCQRSEINAFDEVRVSSLSTFFSSLSRLYSDQEPAEYFVPARRCFRLLPAAGVLPALLFFGGRSYCFASQIL